MLSPNTGQLAYVQTRLRANSPTLCELAYVGEFASNLDLGDFAQPISAFTLKKFKG